MENLAAENAVELHLIPLRVLVMRALCLSLLATLGLALGLPSVARAEKLAADRLRLIVETDAGGDPDDEQSLVRFLLYANEWDVEGIIANRPHVRRPENRNRRDSGFAIISSFIDAYADVYPRLREHDERYPSPDELRKRTVAGYDDTDEAVRLIIKAVDRSDPRPVWFLNWGTDHGSAESNLKRALDRVLAERGKAGYAKFKQKILLCSDDQFGEHTKSIKPLWRLWVYPFYPNMDGGRWYHRFGPLTAKAGGFDLERDVRSGHGPLGALYPTNTGIQQKEGDSLTFLYLIPTGMNDPLHPSWGSWAGRFGERSDWKPPNANYYWAGERDSWKETTNRDNMLKRWAGDLQNDFRARMDWCVQPRAKANHPPRVLLNGDASQQILTIDAPAGKKVQLSAEGTADPDDDELTYEWFAYLEAGTYRGRLDLQANAPDIRFEVPPDAVGKTIHLIVAVRDRGAPPLARYRRAVLRGVRGD
jgi:hypothetical protein